MIKTLTSSWFLIGILVSLSLFPRLWNLQKSPPLMVDEPANIRDINIILKNGLDVTDFHWDFSKSRVVHALPVLLIKLGVEDKLLALRFSSILLSIATLIPFFFIAKMLTNKFIAFGTTLLFSFSYYFLQFSRVGWTDLILNIFLGLSLFLIIIKVKNQKTLNIGLTIFAGFLASLIFYSYRSGIILLGVSLPFLVFKKLSKDAIKGHIMTISVYLLSFFLLSFPWINTINTNLDKYNLRLRVVSTPINQPDIVIKQAKVVFNSWLLFTPQKGSRHENPRYLPQGYPIVNWFIKLGFWIGFIAGLFQLKKTYPLYIIIFMGLAGQIITINPPNGARGLIVLPCIYLLFAYGIYKIYQLSGNKKVVILSFLLLSITFSALDFSFYKYWMSWISV